MEEFGKQLGATGLGMLQGAVGGILGMSLGNRNAEEQMRRQKELNQQGHELQKDMWDYTNYENQRKHMEKAGLNIGLMYGQGGGGGTTAGSQSGGSAAMAPTPEVMGMALQAQQVAAQTELARAQAAKLRAETPTGGQNLGDINFEETRQKAIALLEDNEVKRFYREGPVEEGEVEMRRNKNLNYGFSKYDELSPKVKEFNAELFKLQAEKNNLDANALLTNTKAQNYWNELLIAQQNADSNMIQAKAQELAKQWETGEFTNWRTWVEIAKDATGMANNLIKAKNLGKPRTK